MRGGDDRLLRALGALSGEAGLRHAGGAGRRAGAADAGGPLTRRHPGRGRDAALALATRAAERLGEPRYRPGGGGLAPTASSRSRRWRERARCCNGSPSSSRGAARARRTMRARQEHQADSRICASTCPRSDGARSRRRPQPASRRSGLSAGQSLILGLDDVLKAADAAGLALIGLEGIRPGSATTRETGAMKTRLCRRRALRRRIGADLIRGLRRLGRRVAAGGARRRGDAGRGALQPVRHRRIVDHRDRRDPGAAAAADASAVAGRRCGDRRASGCSRHHRQPDLLAPGGQACARQAARRADRQLRAADGLGLARGAGTKDAGLCGPRHLYPALRARHHGTTGWAASRPMSAIR